MQKDFHNEYIWVKIHGEFETLKKLYTDSDVQQLIDGWLARFLSEHRWFSRLFNARWGEITAQNKQIIRVTGSNNDKIRVTVSPNFVYYYENQSHY